MDQPLPKTGIRVPDWDALRRDDAAFARFIADTRKKSEDQGVIVLSDAPSMAATTQLRDWLPRAFLADRRILSPARLARLCAGQSAGQAAGPGRPARLAFIVSNGFGLGHVTRTHAFMHGLQAYDAAPAVLSFSAAHRRDAFYMPSAQYLELDAIDSHTYTREAVMRFFAQNRPTHVVYDGNVLPEGMLSALAAHPDIHLTWVRRGMWQKDVAAKFMAQQALADLVIEPGDLSAEYDTGPTWQGRDDYCPPRAFLKTPPIRAPHNALLQAGEAQKALGFRVGKKYALLMLGAQQKSEGLDVLQRVVDAVKSVPDLTPVIAHWPMSHDPKPVIDGAITLERMPIADYYRAFSVIISAAGYNSFHEILGAGLPVIFLPQDDEGRDQQVARAQWAVDNGYAQMCRRDDVSALAAMIAYACPQAPLDRGWMDDWSAVARAMGLVPGGNATPAARARVSPRAFAKILRRAQQRQSLRKKPYRTRLVVAFGGDITRIKPQDGVRTVVVTDRIDPMALRRAGLHYVWLNRESLVSTIAAQRQILAWLRVWRPQSVETI